MIDSNCEPYIRIMDMTYEEQSSSQYDVEEIGKDDIRNVPRTILRQLIETYRAHPALWQVRNKAIYMNRKLKNKGHAELLKVWKHYDPQADVNVVKAKIQSLRGSYRKELKKMEKCQRSGVEAQNIYKSQLWYFRLMNFLRSDEAPTTNMNNIPDSPEPNYEEVVENGLVGHDDEPNEGEASQSPSAYNLNEIPGKKKKISEDAELRDFMKTCTKALNEKLDDADAFGQYIASKLTKVKHPEQRMYAEALMTKVVNKALMNSLQSSTDLMENSIVTCTYASPEESPGH